MRNIVNPLAVKQSNTPLHGFSIFANLNLDSLTPSYSHTILNYGFALGNCKFSSDNILKGGLKL
ncbi:MAG: hypothetical protein ACTSQY_08020 [Candidatus Odinarchaeia archaeon]